MVLEGVLIRPPIPCAKQPYLLAEDVFQSLANFGWLQSWKYLSMLPVSWSSTVLAMSLMSSIRYLRAAAVCGDIMQFSTAAAVIHQDGYL